MINKTEQQNKIRIIKAMMNDDEFLRGGIFQDEDEYCKRYKITLKDFNALRSMFNDELIADIKRYEKLISLKEQEKNISK